VPGDCRGRGLRGRGYTVWLIRKYLIVISQWGHGPWNLETPEAAPAWPVAMAAQPAKQEEAGGRCRCLLWKTSQLSRVYQNGAGQARSTWVIWTHQNWGIPFFKASLSYHAPGMLVSIGLCAIWAWISPSRTGQSGPHCGTQAALISASHTDYLISWCVTSGLGREKWGYMEAQAPIYLTSLLLCLQGTLKHG
jgi:hypothetical protein